MLCVDWLLGVLIDSAKCWLTPPWVYLLGVVLIDSAVHWLGVMLIDSAVHWLCWVLIDFAVHWLRRVCWLTLRCIDSAVCWLTPRCIDFAGYWLTLRCIDLAGYWLTPWCIDFAGYVDWLRGVIKPPKNLLSTSVLLQNTETSIKTNFAKKTLKITSLLFPDSDPNYNNSDLASGATFCKLWSGSDWDLNTFKSTEISL